MKNTKTMSTTNYAYLIGKYVMHYLNKDGILGLDEIEKIKEFTLQRVWRFGITGMPERFDRGELVKSLGDKLDWFFENSDEINDGKLTPTEFRQQVVSQLNKLMESVVNDFKEVEVNFFATQDMDVDKTLSLKKGEEVPAVIVAKTLLTNPELINLFTMVG